MKRRSLALLLAALLLPALAVLLGFAAVFAVLGSRLLRVV
jgi:hypothetical protein